MQNKSQNDCFNTSKEWLEYYCFIAKHKFSQSANFTSIVRILELRVNLIK